MRILSMSGFVPTAICDTIRFDGYSGERNKAHFCGYCNDFISQVINDNTIDGAVYPKSCDSSRIIPSYLSGLEKFQFQINVPTRNEECAVDYYASQLQSLKDSIEEYYDISLGSIKNRIELVNERNKVIGTNYARLESISYKKYIDAIHCTLSQPLFGNDFNTIKTAMVERKNDGHRVYLIGSFLSNTNIADIIENAGLVIVGDNLPESGRIQNSSLNTHEFDPYKTIAKEVLSRRPSPTQSDFAKILEYDLKEIHDLQVEGVIYLSQKYCEPYYYLFSIYKKRLDELHIPLLHLSLLNSEDEGKVNIAVEAFADIM